MKKQHYPQLLIFDWDGTLANSIDNIINCKEKAARILDIDIIHKELIRKTIGMDFQSALRYCLPNSTNEQRKEFKNVFFQLIQEKQHEVHLFPDVIKVLNTAKKKSIKLAIATSKNRKSLNEAIQSLELTNIFDLTCCGEEYVEKPNPDMLFHIIKKLKMDKENSLYVGDTVIDIKFAKNANINIACSTLGASTAEELTSHQPNFIFNHWKEFLSYLKT